MFFPEPIDYAQHHHPLVIAHRLGAEYLLLALVVLLQFLEDFVAQLVTAKFLGLDVR